MASAATPELQPVILAPPQPTFDRLEAVCLAVGSHPDDVLSMQPKDFPELCKRAESTDVDALIEALGELPGGIIVSDGYAAGVVLMLFIEESQRHQQRAAARQAHYADRLGFVSESADEVVDLARILARLPAGEALELRHVPLEQMLVTLAMRGTEAAFNADQAKG